MAATGKDLPQKQLMGTSKTQDYDDEPVAYCSKCYSLKIGYEEALHESYCMDCGNTDILETSIEEWEKLYEARYGHKFAVKNTDPKKSPVFSFSLRKLKDFVKDSPFFDKIVRDLYPRAPLGLNKADMFVWLFDKVERDRKLDDLRMSLWKHIRHNK